ncbi:prohibitin family protein [Agathobacter rectalis]|jgi:regulator of protease activity HflC (stomatin/prohibitin superfamily)|uniref:Prohibitin family protein n=1 Tax=Agathobacter rectalis TaxID=39491 RepID=A0A414ZR75_9FIRM|nr:prohibitin family protein [Agathobacter rectalis]RHI25714.1 prohibitin family protein [Agathobacter rectalis]
MKKLGGFVVVIVLVIGVIICMKSLVKVPAGYVAVQYNANGGVKKEVLNQGWHWKSPMVKTTLYTVGLEQSYLTASKKGDSPDDDSFTASSSEGKSMTLELTYTYQYKPNSVADVFTRFKGQSGKEVRDSFIKPNIVSWTKEIVANYKVSDILGSERANINNAVSDYLAKKFEPYGITISNVSLINIDVDKDTMKAINAKIKAQQDAETQAIQNQTNIDKAKADAEAEVTKAQGDADAKVIAAQAEADANAKINSSITDQLIRMKEAEARLKHGWVTVQGSDTVVTKNADSDQ